LEEIWERPSVAPRHGRTNAALEDGKIEIEAEAEVEVEEG